MSSINPPQLGHHHGRDNLPVPSNAPEMIVYDPYTQRDWKDDGFDLKRIWQIIVRYRWLILSVAAVSVFTTMVATLMMRPVYSASAVIEVKPNQGVIEFGNLQRFRVDAHEFRNTQVNILESDFLAKYVISELDLAGDPEFNGELEQHGLVMVADILKETVQFGISTVWAAVQGLADPASGESSTGQIESNDSPEAVKQRMLIERYQDKLEVREVGNSDLLRITFESFIPRKAADLANAHTRAYMETSDERRFNSTSSAKNYLQQEIARAQSNLETSERELHAFARENDIIDVEDRSNVMEGRLEELNSALTKTRQERITAQVEFEQARQGELSSLPAVLDNDLISRLRDQYANLQAQYQEMSKTFKDTYPRMQQLKSRMNNIKASLEEESRALVGGLKNRWEQLAKQEDKLVAELAKERSKMLDLKERAISYNILKREWEANRELYAGLLDKQKDFSVASGMEINNASIIDEAMVPVDKEGPNTTRNATMAGVFGLMGGMGIAFLLAFLDNTFKTREELERSLDMPFLGIMPKVGSNAGNAPIPLLSGYEPSSSIAEASRTIRTNVLFSRPHDVPKKILVTSTASGEGKTTVAINLALVLAQNGSSVLIMDADLRRPAVSNLLGVQDSTGIADYLRGKNREIIKSTSFKNLYCVPSGERCGNPTDLLGSTKMDNCLDKLSSRFDFVILDAPPCLGLADSMILSAKVDGVLVVVKAGSTERGAAEETIKRLRIINAPLIGSVLNWVDLQQPEYGYLRTYYACGENAGRKDAEQWLQNT
jgi:capsular exopolysaccharide synthesis family protein